MYLFIIHIKSNTVELRDQVNSRVARIYFYLHDRHDLLMSKQQQRLFMAWDKQFPVTEWEPERNRRIAERMGHSNPLVTGERIWALDHRNTADGVYSKIPANHSASSKWKALSAIGMIRGNRNSRVYHLPAGCPSYDAMKPKSIVEFSSEAEAQAAGYRKAGNCR